MCARVAMAALLSMTLATAAHGAPGKVLVLPVDGTADAAMRAKVTAQIVRLAKGLDGQVAAAEATFADTALAVGCDPHAATCSDQVIAMLGVEELVWGTASRDGRQTRVVVRRAGKGRAPREVAMMVAATDSNEQIAAAIAPLFARADARGPGAPASAATRTEGLASTATGSETVAGAVPEGRSPAIVALPASGGATSSTSEPAGIAASGRAASTVAPPRRRPESTVAVPVEQEARPGSAASASGAVAVAVAPGDHRDRNVGIGLVAGGAGSLAVGLALLASYASLQSSIDKHATRTRADFDDLQSLEDRASAYAIAGDIAVAAGLVAGGVGTYYLVRARRVVVAPARIGGGGGVTVVLVGGL